MASESSTHWTGKVVLDNMLQVTKATTTECVGSYFDATHMKVCLFAECILIFKSRWSESVTGKSCRTCLN